MVITALSSLQQQCYMWRSFAYFALSLSLPSLGVVCSGSSFGFGSLMAQNKFLISTDVRHPCRFPISSPRRSTLEDDKETVFLCVSSWRDALRFLENTRMRLTWSDVSWKFNSFERLMARKMNSRKVYGVDERSAWSNHQKTHHRHRFPNFSFFAHELPRKQEGEKRKATVTLSMYW
jgi:hypothetical protein